MLLNCTITDGLNDKYYVSFVTVKNILKKKVRILTRSYN